MLARARGVRAPLDLTTMQFPDHDLARRLQTALAYQHQNFIARVREARPEAGVETLPLGGRAQAVYSGPASPFTRISGIGVDQPASADQFDAAERFYFKHNEPCRVDVCPLSDPTLIELVRDRGYTLGSFTNVYFRSPPSEDEHLRPAPGLRIAIARDTDGAEIDRILDTIHRGFGGPDARRDSLWHTVRCAIARPGTALFAVYADDVEGPIAGGSMEFVALTDGRVIAAMAGAATHEAYRKRGAQTALLRARLALARERVAAGMPCDVVMIQTRPGIASERNILRHGFRLAYTRPQMVRPPA